MTPAEFYFQKGFAEGRKQGFAEGRRQGRIQGRLTLVKRILIKFGTKRFGIPTDVELEKINQIMDPALLEQLFDRMDDVSRWSDLISA